jgi:hypothetical protein
VTCCTRECYKHFHYQCKHNSDPIIASYQKSRLLCYDIEQIEKYIAYIVLPNCPTHIYSEQLIGTCQVGMTPARYAYGQNHPIPIPFTLDLTPSPIPIFVKGYKIFPYLLPDRVNGTCIHNKSNWAKNNCEQEHITKNYKWCHVININTYLWETLYYK